MKNGNLGSIRFILYIKITKLAMNFVNYGIAETNYTCTNSLRQRTQSHVDKIKKVLHKI